MPLLLFQKAKVAKFKKVTPSTLVTVLERLTRLALEDPDSRKAFCPPFNRFLDELLNEDFFGTEGQIDPRGDHRD